MGKQLRDISLRMIIPTVAWMYAVVLIFVWYFARYLPDELVLVRIGGSIVSDLVWLPLGVFVWGAAAIYASIPFPIRRARYAVAAVVVLLAVWNHHAAFRWLFLPLAYVFVKLLTETVRGARSYRRVVPFFFCVLLTVLYYNSQLLPHPVLRHASDSLKVMSYNIYSKAGVLNRHIQVDTIRRENPDIVCIMEFYPRSDYSLFRERLGDRYPYMVSNRSETSWNSGELIMSRFPILSRKIVPIPGDRYDMDFLFTELAVGETTINLINYHFITAGHHIIDQVFSSKSLFERIKIAAAHESGKDRVKYQQVLEMSKFAGKLNDPVIICGDMNDTPNSRTYRVLNSHYTNAFADEGWGLGDSFGEVSLARKLPSFVARDVIRIDHIFVSDDIKVTSVRAIDDAAGSDHKPLVAVLQLK